MKKIALLLLAGCLLLSLAACGGQTAAGPGERPAEEPTVGERPATPAQPGSGESLATPAEVGDEERDNEWLRDPSITVERDGDGNIVKYIRTEDNWVEEFNADKTLIKTTSYRADGTVEEERFYDATGNITREVSRDPAVGLINEITYSGGVKTTVVTTSPDSTITTTYRANGSRIREELIFANGDKLTSTYSEADLFTYVCNITQGGNVVWEIFYDAAGNPSTGTINAEGIISTLIYQPDGGYEQWFTSPEGYEVYNKFAADGSVIVCLIGDDAPPRP